MQEGNINLIGTYSGKSNDGCSLVSIVKRVDGFSKADTLNYKVCGNEVRELGETAPSNLPQNIQQIIHLVGMSAIRYGAFELAKQGYTLKGVKLNEKM